MRRRLVPLLLVASLGLGACGVEHGDAAGPATTTTERQPTTTTTGPDTTAPRDVVDALAQTYRTLGFTDEEATCLAEGLAGLLDGAGTMPDTGSMMDVVNGCDIDASRLGEINRAFTDDPQAALRTGLVAGFTSQGLTEDQATCLADAFLDAYGADVTAAADPDKLLPLLEQCDLTASDFGN